MKRTSKVFPVAIIIAVLLANLIAFSIANAADKLLDAKVVSVTEGTSKNGQPYVRLIIEEPKTLNGVNYTAQASTMAFGSHAATAKALKPGQTIKMVVTETPYQGRPGYTVQAFVPSK